MEQIDIKSSGRSRCGVELGQLLEKEEDGILGPPSSVCRQRVLGVVVGVLGVKSLIEHDSEG